MKKILYISLCYPYEEAKHAGGKTVAYYSNLFAQEKNVDVCIICKIRDNEKGLAKQNSHMHIHAVSMPKEKMKKLFAYIISINSKINPYCRYGNTITKYIRSHLVKEAYNLKREGYNPDIIILEWTEMVVLIDIIKALFPDAFIVCSEHDVKYQSLRRKYKSERNIFMRWIKYIRFKTIKKFELNALRQGNLIAVQSGKDKRLLVNEGINDTEIIVISPFYMKTIKKWQDNESENIIIYGDMSREENYGGAIWFINNVFNKVSDKHIKLIIVGGNPPEQLYKYSRENIIITGYVDNVFEYMDNSYCMVVPLQLGAGIKVKCLEALSYGIPLITNEIGIEGIDAVAGKDYLLCSSTEDYLTAIKQLRYDHIARRKLSLNAIEYASSHLDIERSYQEYRERIGI